jgi:Ca2+-binding RTX toxin-like protein
MRIHLKGTKADDQLHGTEQNDIISGGGGDDVIAGQGGSDRLSGGDGADTLYGGVAPLESAAGPVGIDLLIGGEGDDWLEGGDGTNLLHGGAGNDQLFGGSGSRLNIFDGGAGDDGYMGTYDSTNIFVFEALEEGGGFGRDSMIGFRGAELRDDDRLVFVGYTTADLAGPIQTVMPDGWYPAWYWRFDFRDGSSLVVSLYDDLGMGAAGTPPVAGQDYVFA